MQILSIRLRLIFQFRGENGFYVLYLYLNRVELSGGRCFFEVVERIFMAEFVVFCVRW